MKEYLVSARTNKVVERDYVGEPPEEPATPTGYVIPKDVILERLEAAGVLDDILSALDQQSQAARRFRAYWDAVPGIKHGTPFFDRLNTFLLGRGVATDTILAPWEG